MDVLLTTAEVAQRLRMPEATLRYWRAIGKGPSGRKVGRRVLYSLADVEAADEPEGDAVSTAVRTDRQQTLLGFDRLVPDRLPALLLIFDAVPSGCEEVLEALGGEGWDA